MAERKHLRVDPARRLGERKPRLGQFCRAYVEDGTVGTVAVEELDAASFHVWMGSRDSRAFIEDCLARVLDYGYLHQRDPMGRWPAVVPKLAELDPVAAIDARIDAIFKRSGMSVMTIDTLEAVLWMLLDLRGSLIATDVDLRAKLFEVAHAHGIECTAFGPSVALAAQYGGSGIVPVPAVLFYRAWVEACRS